MYLWEERKQYLLVAINLGKILSRALVFWKSTICRKEIMAHRGKKFLHLKDSCKATKLKCTFCKMKFPQKLIELLNFKKMQDI
jgi:hypothetical protein